MHGVTFGKYIPIDSVMHRLDPRSKIIALFIMIAAVFVPKSWWAFLVIGVVVVVEVLLAKLSINFIYKAVKPMFFMMLVLLVINILTIKTGDVLFTIGRFSVYKDGIMNTLFIVVRLLLMILLTTTLTATTKPLDLTLGIEKLLSPLKVVHFPAHETAMMISIALRFIPTILEETERIMNAQKSRGVDFEQGSLKEKAGAILSLIVPLFSVSFERAYELADAMEARGYVPGAERTRYRILTMHFRDYAYILISLAVLACSILTRIYL